MPQHQTVDAFVLGEKRPIQWQSAPNPNEIYDPKLQIWVRSDTGKPLVLMEPEDFMNSTCTSFGETIITETREGIDQPEGIQFSPFGETLQTATREGIDQPETCSRYFMEEETE